MVFTASRKECHCGNRGQATATHESVGQRWAQHLHISQLHHILFFLCLCFLSLAFAPLAQATDYTWVGNVSAEWTNSANWTPTGFPNNSSDTATFNTPGTKGQTITILNSVAANAITFNTSGWTITSGQNPGIALNGTTPTITTATGASTISAAIGGTSLTTAGSGTLTISGVISSTSLTAASGILILAGPNTYTGGTTVTAGTLRLSGSGTLGSTGGNLTVSGGTLDLNGTSQTVNNLGPSTSGGTILNNSGSGTSTLTITTGSTYGGLIKDNTTGAGTVALVVNFGQTLTGANTYSGGTTISNGASLQLNTNSTATAGTGSIALQGSSTLNLGAAVTVTNDISGSGNVYNFNSSPTIVVLRGALSYTGNTIFHTIGSTFNFASNVNSALSGVIGPTGSGFVVTGNIIKSGTGTLTLSGINKYTGTTTISGGTLQLGVANAINSASTMTLNGGIFNTGGFSQTFTKPLTLSSNSGIDLGSGNSVLTYGDSSGTTWAGQLVIFNWSGSQAGNGSDRLLIGSSANLGTRLAQIRFYNPVNLSPGVYNATQLATGEVVPSGVATFVKLISFTATRYSHVLWLNWQTGFETDNLGFNVYREINDKKVRLNGSTLIAGSALLTGTNNGFNYAWPDALQAPGTKYWLEDVDTFGKSSWHGPITPRPGSGSAAGQRRSPLLGQM